MELTRLEIVMPQRRRAILVSIGIILILVMIIQIIPWGSVFPAFAQTNPPIITRIEWDSPRTEQLVRTACYDCHSNETSWPWYARITPVSWLLAHDVNEGRQNLNFSTQSADQINPNELIEQIQRGEMPKSIYTVMHPDAILSDTQKAELIAGLQASLHGTHGGRRGG